MIWWTYKLNSPNKWGLVPFSSVQRIVTLYLYYYYYLFFIYLNYNPIYVYNHLPPSPILWLVLFQLKGNTLSSYLSLTNMLTKYGILTWGRKSETGFWIFYSSGVLDKHLKQFSKSYQYVCKVRYFDLGKEIWNWILNIILFRCFRQQRKNSWLGRLDLDL